MSVSQYKDIDEKGWLEAVKKTPSPNFHSITDREVSLLVIHCISLPEGKYASGYVEDFFLNRLDEKAHPYFASIHKMRVASHLFIDRKGNVQQFVSLNDCAHHAGQSEFEGRENCNEFSIGIELEGTDSTEFTDSQYEALSIITKSLVKKYSKITPERIVGHSDIAPERKTDPGPGFDWKRYRGSVFKNAEVRK